ncbi:AAA family ATPase, partial [Niallia circulans]
MSEIEIGKDAKVISFINMKGGVGKTTLTKEIGYFLAT